MPIVDNKHQIIWNNSIYKQIDKYIYNTEKSWFSDGHLGMTQGICNLSCIRCWGIIFLSPADNGKYPFYIPNRC